ncbi:hypothetical protein SEEN443_14892 [Salmonella enterica subsp. enterica serovar Newport str. CVM 19443]|nr:hypothetical protein SEEN443_14892 [Salmonella enterica subsp. enterica serovar Newport str. CVM 19443]
MINLRNHIFRDTGRCRASIPVGRSVGDARAQGKPQPDAHGRRELKGETVKPERSNDRKIAADVKEGPGDRRVHFTLVSTTARLRWMHGTARTRHRADRVENHQATSHRDGAAIKAEPATSFSASESPADKRRGFPLPSLT